MAHHPRKRGKVVKNRILACGVLVAAAVASGLIASGPASAQAPTDGGHSSSRSSILHHGANWDGNRNAHLNRIRVHLRDRNRNVAVNRQLESQSEEARVALVARRAAQAAAACIDSAVQGNTKFVALTRNGQLFVQEVTLTPTPTPLGWQNASSVFPGFTSTCVTLAVMGDNLHVTVLGADGTVLQAACMVNPPPTEFPSSCGAPISLGSPTGVSGASAANRTAAVRPTGARRAALQPPPVAIVRSPR